VQGIRNICILSADHSNPTPSITNCLVAIVHTKPDIATKILVPKWQSSLDTRSWLCLHQIAWPLESNSVSHNQCYSPPKTKKWLPHVAKPLSRRVSAISAFVKLLKWKLPYFGHMIRAQNLCTHIWRLSRWRKRQTKAKEMTGRWYKRPDWEDAGGVCDNSKRREELERTCALFCGLLPSATKMENNNNDVVWRCGLITTPPTITLGLM